MSHQTGVHLSVSGASGAALRRRRRPDEPARVLAIGRADGSVAARDGVDRPRRARRLTLDNLDDTLATLGPTVNLAQPGQAAGPTLAVSLRSLESFHPDDLLREVPLLSQLRTLRRQLDDPRQSEAAVKLLGTWGVLPGAAAQAAAPSSTAPGSTSASQDIERLLGRPASASNPSAGAGKDAAGAALDQWIASIVQPHVAPTAHPQGQALGGVVDGLLAQALTSVLHAPAFQAAESLWRGADFLLRRVDEEALAGVELLDWSWAEVADDLQAAGSAGLLASLLAPPPDDDGAPPAVSHVVIGQPLQLDEPTLEALARLAALAAATGAQVLVSPRLEQFFDRQGALDPQAQARWDALRRQPWADALVLVAPRFVLRQPYGAGSDPVGLLPGYAEPLAGGQGDAVLWGHPGWLLLADELAGGQGVVDDLPYLLLEDEAGAGLQLHTTEWALNPTLAGLLEQFGITTLQAHRAQAQVRLGRVRNIQVA